MSRISSRIRLACLFILAGGAVLLVGCSRPTGSITGKVSFKGQPLKAGNISFVSTEGQPTVSSVVGEDGTYNISSIAVGNYKVCIENQSYASGGAAKDSYASYGNKMNKNKGKEAEAKPLDPSITPPEGYHPSNPKDTPASRNKKDFPVVPDSYGKAESTDLTYTVVSGSQNHDFDLK